MEVIIKADNVRQPEGSFPEGVLLKFSRILTEAPFF